MKTILRITGGPVHTERTARWEDEVGLEGEGEAFGAEANPTGNPIGGGEGYTDVFAEGDYTVRTYEELQNALGQASAGQVIFLSGDAEIDMGGRETLSIPEGVTVASTRGHRGSVGALVFSDEMDTPALFVSAGDCVRVTGLRVRGPYPGRGRIDHSANGIRSVHFGMEIDNCEVFAFSVAATGFTTGASRAYVHHNHIHHNQRSGLGYGVSVGGGEVLVEANRFDWCRHHIASSGAPGSAYEARYNVCGEHANGHLFDMHGGRDRGDATDIAGDWMNVHHNTFMCTEFRSVGIRGVPSQGAAIHHNWFYSVDPENVVRTSGKTEVYENVFGPEQTLIDRLEVRYE